MTASDGRTKPIQVLRERVGGPSAELRAAFKEQQRVRKLLRQALAAGPKTVPQLAAACALDAAVVLWHVMALRRYGGVAESGLDGDAPVYALKGAPS